MINTALSKKKKYEAILQLILKHLNSASIQKSKGAILSNYIYCVIHE